MKYQYHQLQLKSYNIKEDTDTPSSKITLFISLEQIQKEELPSSLEMQLQEAFKKDTNTTFIHWVDNSIQCVVSLPCKAPENLRKAGAELYKNLQKRNLTQWILTPTEGLQTKEYLYFIEGMLLSSYHFNKYKKQKENNSCTLYIATDLVPEKEIEELSNLADAIALTKTLVNEPLNFMDSLKFAEIAVEIGKTHGFETEILDKEAIEALKMGGVLGVNRGSETPPTFNIFKYQPENAVNTKPLVLVGKGVMFDTGGYSLKVGGSMTSMKSDMAGGAAVLGTVAAIAANQLPYYVIGLVPATDNKISSNALVVDDVITMMDGTTVEVQNTDAEGRLVLADALTYAQRFNPELVIDMATLTGASATITGDYGIAMAGNTHERMQELKTSGELVYERLFELPFWKEYEELLKSDIADLKNIGGKTGGATTAGKFLEHFTNYPWIHLDIAGAAFIDKAKDYRQSGGTGVPIRLLYHFIKTQSTKKQ